MKYAALILVLSTVSLYADNDKLYVEGLNAYYDLWWHTIIDDRDDLIIPELDVITVDLLQSELKGSYTYSYVDYDYYDETIKGNIWLSSSRFHWNSKNIHGTIKLYGNIAVLFGNGKRGYINAMLLRIKGDWYLMQLKFPDGIVKLIENPEATKHSRKRRTRR